MSSHTRYRLAGCLILLVLLIGTSMPVSAACLSNEQVQYVVYLGGVSRNHAQCGVIPNLFSPPDGSILNTNTPTLVFNGGNQPQANATWLQLDLSQDPDFATMYFTHYLQPAQEDWEYEILDTLEPGTYYWRAALWCNGPGWPPPPNPGEIRGPFSGARSFTIQP